MWSGVNIFSPFPSWFLLSVADSSLSNSGMFVVSDSSYKNPSTISFSSDKIYSILFWLLVSLGVFNILSTSLTILLHFFKNSCLSNIPLPKSFSKLSVLSSVIYLSSAFVLNPSFLALVTVLNIALNLFSLMFTHFGNINLPGLLLIRSELNK